MDKLDKSLVRTGRIVAHRLQTRGDVSRYVCTLLVLVVALLVLLQLLAIDGDKMADSTGLRLAYRQLYPEGKKQDNSQHLVQAIPEWSEDEGRHLCYQFANIDCSKQTIHPNSTSVVMCVPCLTYTDVRSMSTLLKSIKLNSKRRIRLRVITTLAVSRTVQVFLKTWDLYKVTVYYGDIRRRPRGMSQQELNQIFANQTLEIHHKYMFVMPNVTFPRDIGYYWDELNASELAGFTYMNGTVLSHKYQSLHSWNIENLNGDNYRTPPTKEEERDLAKNLKEDSCYRYRHSASMSRRTHICFYCHENEKPKYVSNDITIITQLMANRIVTLAEVLRAWQGPASITFYLTDDEATDLAKILDSGFLPTRANIKYHVVYARGLFYPVNYLRNIALQEVTTDYFLVLDVDFVPMKRLYSILRSLVPLKSKEAWIVPAFETSQTAYEVPSSKSELLPHIRKKIVQQFHVVKWTFGHKFLNYTRWAHTNVSYEVKPSGNNNQHFEPYLMMARKGAPRFNELLVDRMVNKVEFVNEVRDAGYKLMALPDGFIVHIPHPDSEGVKLERGQRYIHEKCKYRFVELVRSRRWNKMHNDTSRD